MSPRRRTLWNMTVGRVVCRVAGHLWTLRRSFDIEWDFCYRCWNAITEWRASSSEKSPGRMWERE